MTTNAAGAAISPNEAACAAAAGELLRRHERDEPEANITSAVRDFLVAAGLCQPHEIVEENPPSLDSSRRAVDLTALDTFIESKRRIGMAQRGVPDAAHIAQLDGYLESSQRSGRVRMGILTDGKYWVLRWPGAGEVKTTRPYAIILESADQWRGLHEWLRDDALVALENISPNRSDIEKHFGINSPRYLQDIATLRALYEQARDNPSIAVKRRLWQDLLRTALGEIAQDDAAMDDLFIRHTYLTTVIGIVVQASFGIDIRGLAETRPDDLVLGQKFRSDTGLEGVVESDFFAWPTEVGADGFLRQLAKRVARFNWLAAPTDVAAILYETVIPPAERRQLGEYYTPHWLARAMVREIVADPLNERVLDPACGSGAFLAEAIAHFIEASDRDRDPLDHVDAGKLLDQLRECVIGIDVHPVAVHLARAAWVLAAKPLFDRIGADGGSRPSSNFSAPVYLGDSLQLRSRNDMFSGQDVPIHVGGDDDIELRFPVSLVSRAENFDSVIADVTSAIESGDDPSFVLDQAGVFDVERPTLEQTIRDLQKLHNEGRNHIWAYYTRNMVRPVALSLQKVDVIIGNPPWIKYSQTLGELREGLESLSRNNYGIWVGGPQYTSYQDVAGLFFSRSVDLYLRDGGVIGFVLPHSALQSGHYSRWRSGQWVDAKSGRNIPVDFTFKVAWDLQRLKPNTFFPAAASVSFARKLPQEDRGKPLAGFVDQWHGEVGAGDLWREPAVISDTGGGYNSPYAALSRSGAKFTPRSLIFVNEVKNPAIVQAAQTVTVNPRRGIYDKKPWKDLDLTTITGQTVERSHLFEVYLGESIAPYVTLEPSKALLPLKQGDSEIPKDDKSPSGIRSGGLDRRMRERWETVWRLWEENKPTTSKLSLLETLDFIRQWSAQLAWQRNRSERPLRVLYTGYGAPTAAMLPDHKAVVDHKLYWLSVADPSEAQFLMAIINSNAMYEAVQPLMTKGLFGSRDLHKHLWKLPIPEYDEAVELHRDLVQAGEAAAAGVQLVLAKLREERGDKLTVTIARREIRKWLRESDEGAAVERLVGELLGG